MEERWGTLREDPGAPPRISMVHLPEEGSCRVLPKRLGSESSLVYTKLLAASPAVFTRIRVVCEPRCQTSVPEILNLLTPNSCRPPPGRREGTGSGRSLQRATPLTPPLLSPHPKGRNFWDGLMVHRLFLLLLPAGVSRAGKKLRNFPVSSQSPECPHTVATGTTEWASGRLGWRVPGRRGSPSGLRSRLRRRGPAPGLWRWLPATITLGARRAQWLAMLLLRSLLLLLLLGAPRSFAEGAVTALPRESVPWQGECPPGQRDQTRTAGAGVVTAEKEGAKLGAGRGEKLRRLYLYGGRVSLVPRRPAFGPVLHPEWHCIPLFLARVLLLAPHPPGIRGQRGNRPGLGLKAKLD